MSTISESTDIVTLINVFTVTPEDQGRLIEALRDLTERTMRGVPGFVSANLHRSLDGTRVVNYGQWRSRAAFDAMAADPDARAGMAACARLAHAEPHLYLVDGVFEASRP